MTALPARPRSGDRRVTPEVPASLSGVDHPQQHATGAR